MTQLPAIVMRTIVIYSLFIIASILGRIGSVYAQTVPPANKFYLNALPVGETFKVRDPEYNIFTFGNPANSFRDQLSMGVVSIGFDPDVNECYPLYHQLTIDLDITYKAFTTWPSFTSHNINRTLVIDYDPALGIVNTEKALLYIPDVLEIDVTLNSFQVKDAAGNVIAVYTTWGTLPPDMFVEAKIDVARFYNFNFSTLPSLSISYDNTANEYEVTPSLQAFAEFIDLEWMYINDYDPASNTVASALSQTVIPVNFTNNATRVRLRPEDLPYRIPNIFDRGYVVFRARYVGRDQNNLQKTVLGKWNILNDYNDAAFLNTISNANKIQVSAHEAGKNWQLGITYAEEGKHKHIAGYADGSLRTRQQVTLISSDDNALVAETFYDHIGRAAVQSLPAPTTTRAIGYIQNFNTNTGSSKYNYQDFEKENLANCAVMPDPFSTAAGAGKYYSTANTLQNGMQAYVPDAEGYPFVVTQFTPDNTGRVRNQGGVGAAHVLGGTHDTKYLYSVAVQEELDMLFGSDIGYEQYYKKMMVTDANGQVSVSYLDMMGRVIATALAGEIPANLDGLKNDNGDELATEEAVTITSDMLNKTPNFPQGKNNILSTDGLSRTVVREISVPANYEYTFNYSATGLDYDEDCLEDLCIDCMYDVSLSLLDECGNEMLPSGKVTGRIGGNTLDESCNVSQTLPNLADFQGLEVNIGPGTYTFIKILSLYEPAIDYYVEEMLEHDTCLAKLEDFFIFPDTSDCNMTCESCTDDLEEMGTFEEYLDNYIANLPPGNGPVDTSFYRNALQETYDEKVALCATLCRNISLDLCEAGYRMMIADMTPGGQYARYQVVDNEIMPGDVLSILGEMGFLPKRENSQFTGTFHFGGPGDGPVTSWRNPKFKDGTGVWQDNYIEANGTPAMVEIIPDGSGNYIPEIIDLNTVIITNGVIYTPPQNLRYVTDFINHWKDSWAQALIVYHPEYFHYEYCASKMYQTATVDGKTLNSGEYDAWLLSLSYTDAQTIFGGMNNYDLTALDPYFDNHGADMVYSSTLSGIMTISSDNFVHMGGSNYFNIWQTAYYLNHLSGNPGMSYGAAMMVMPGSNTGLIGTDYDWASLVSNYISAKQRTYITAQQVYALYRINLNLCIGNPDFLNYNNPSLSLLNPCSQLQAVFYTDRQVRFGSEAHAKGKDPFENDPPTMEELQEYADQQYFQETGNCPLARDLKNMFAALAADERLTQNTTLQNSVYVTSALMTAFTNVNDHYIPVLSVSGKVLSWNMDNCPMMLWFDPGTPNYVNFNNLLTVVEINDVIYSSGVSDFNLRVVVKNPNTDNLETYTVHGKICIDLTGCGSFQSFCKITPQAKSLFRLMQTLNAQGDLTNSSTNLTGNALYESLLLPELVSAIGVNGNYQWLFDGINEFKLINTSNSAYLSVQISNWDGVSSGSPFVMLSMLSPDALVPSPGSGSGFLLPSVQSVIPVPEDYLMNNVVPTNTIEGSVTVVGSSGQFPVTECEPLKPLDCQLPENKNLAELEAIILNLIITPGSLPEEGSCISELSIVEGGVVDWSNYTALEQVIADMSQSNNGSNSYWFKATVSIGGGVSTVVTGRYCKPLRNCMECSQTERCEATFVLDLPPANEVTTPASFAFGVPGGSDCLKFLDRAFTFTGANGSTPNEFYESCAQFLTGSYPGLTVTVENNQMFFSFPIDLFGPSCDCEDEVEVSLYMNRDEQDVATITCCTPMQPVPGCHQDVQDLQQQLQDALAGALADYNADLVVWMALCGGIDDDPSCEISLAAIEADYFDAVEAINDLYNPQIADAEANCDQWNTEIVVVTPDCNPAFMLFPPDPYEDNCAEHLIAVAHYNAQMLYEQYLDSVRSAKRALLIAHCMGIAETLTVTYELKEYHYTLYYYDQAGNLVRTVPPKAVTRITDLNDLASVKVSRNTNGTPVRPAHAIGATNAQELVTEYLYNSLNQPVKQYSPDGGESRFFYDELGRLVVSQNAQQASIGNNYYSYTKFDAQGRIREVGQIQTALNPMNQATAGNNTALNQWFSLFTSQYRQVTRTFYDNPVGFGMAGQTNLRKRVVATTYEELAQVNPANYTSAIFYDYDIHGNVKQVWNVNKALANISKETTTVHYYYDLVSGKVNGVAYNPEERDRFFHKYEYDADNRLVSSQSWEGYEWGNIGLDIASRLSWTGTTLPLDMISIWPWDHDSKYEYYKHGPMSRMEIGENKVQGMDYVYTIHGWLKSVNSGALGQTYDPGLDGDNAGGNPHRYFGRDAMGFVLHYYTGDNKVISTNTSFEPVGNANGFLNTTFASGKYKPLYNGNIAATVTTLKDPISFDPYPLGTHYGYDQLNRITSSHTFSALTVLSNTWGSETSVTGTKSYNTNYSYDANGNIKTLYRSGDASINVVMDDLKYYYKTNKNQLDYVDDFSTIFPYSEDIKDQSPGNYDYDLIGNLVKDVKENIANIEWTVYGKVKKVTRTSVTSTQGNMEFSYDPLGRRLSKRVDYSDRTVRTWYSYDASGNVMAVYETEGITLNNMTLKEQMIYGSSRLGLKRRNVDMTEALVIDPLERNIVYIRRGEKRYELNNHLGNVQAVVSDRRARICSSGSFQYYEAEIMNATDYYPFGMAMPGRKFSKQLAEMISQRTTIFQTDFENAVYGTIGTVEHYDGWQDEPPVSDVDVPFSNNRRLMVSSSHCTQGTVQIFSVTANESYSIAFDLDIGTTSKVNLLWWEKNALDAMWTYRYVIGSLNANGTYTFSITPTKDQVLLQFRQDDCSSNRYFYLDNISIYTIDQAVMVQDMGDYRFGFNGMEKDDEVSGAGNSYTAEYWQYDSRLGRRWNVDPITYPWQSPYAAFNNNPIYFADPLGLKGTEPEKKGDPENEEGLPAIPQIDITDQATPGWEIKRLTRQIEEEKGRVGFMDAVKIVKKGFGAGALDALKRVGTAAAAGPVYPWLLLWENKKLFSGEASGEDIARAVSTAALPATQFWWGTYDVANAYENDGIEGALYVGSYFVGGATVDGGTAFLIGKLSIAQTKPTLTTFKGVSPNVQNVLNTIDNFKSQGGTVKLNPLNPAQEINMTFQKGTQKLDFRIETHPLPKKFGGNGVTPQRHMNVDLYPNKNVLLNSGHKILE